jgi:hypothetical protein
MEIQLRLRQQAELGAPTQDNQLPKNKKKKKVSGIVPDMRAVHGRLARSLLRTARRKAEGDNYREVQT